MPTMRFDIGDPGQKSPHETILDLLVLSPDELSLEEYEEALPSFNASVQAVQVLGETHRRGEDVDGGIIALEIMLEALREDSPTLEAAYRDRIVTPLLAAIRRIRAILTK